MAARPPRTPRWGVCGGGPSGRCEHTWCEAPRHGAAETGEASASGGQGAESTLAVAWQVTGCKGSDRAGWGWGWLHSQRTGWRRPESWWRDLFRGEGSEGTEGRSSGETTPVSSGDQNEMMRLSAVTSGEDVSARAVRGSGSPLSETRSGSGWPRARRHRLLF